VERGWTGTAQVRLAIDGNGRLRRVSLAGSSGHALLDAKAQTIIGRAAESTPLPLALLGHEFFVDFPVEFRLEDGIVQR
jgi:TonB family protein